MIRRCPTIEKLEAFAAGKAPKVEKHVVKCVACQGLLALMVGGTGDGLEEEDCARTELLLAAGDSGPLTAADRAFLRDHASSCLACKALIDGGDPSD